MTETTQDPFATPEEELDQFRLNNVIESMEHLNRWYQPVRDVERAWTMAHIEKPYMDRAVGHLAVAAQARVIYNRDKLGPNFMPVVALVHALREDNQMRKARRHITHAYQETRSMLFY